jgi:hypothetical protein
VCLRDWENAMADNDTMQSNPAGAMVAGYRRQVETCRKVADLMLDTTGRLEQIGLKVARSALHGGLDAAGSLGTADGGAPSMAPPNVDALMQFQREIADTIGAMNGEMVRLMTEYGTQLSQSFGMSMMPNMTAGYNAPGFDALARSWNEAMQRYTSMIQGATSQRTP